MGSGGAAEAEAGRVSSSMPMVLATQFESVSGVKSSG